MATVRRWYIYLVCFVSLQAVALAVIELLRNTLSAFRAPPLSLAFQMAVIIIGLPVFLVHWLLARRAARETDERASGVRRFYLYLTLATFTGWTVGEVYGLWSTLLRWATGASVQASSFSGSFIFTPAESITRGVVALLVLGALWAYHWRVLAADMATTEMSEGLALLRRLYVLLFSATGVSLTIAGLVSLLRWLLYQFGPSRLAFGEGGAFAGALAALLTGLPLWLTFWGWAQRLMAGPDPAERESALRKFYLYAIVGVSVITGVTNLTFILAGIFRRLLSLTPQGDIRDVLPVIAGMGVLWGYHAVVLRADAARAATAPRQAGVRRLYEYLVAAIGLTAFLIGLGGVISVLIQSLANLMGLGLREQLALSAAALLAGLPVWLLPWRRSQLAAAVPAAAGVDERRSTLRRLYLYLFIFAATMTVLSSAVYVVYRLLSLFFGESGGSLFVDLGQALAFIGLGVAVWVYHGLTIRADNQRNRQAHAAKLAAQRVAVVARPEDPFVPALLAGLRRALPDLAPDVVDLTEPQDEPARAALEARLASAGLIVASWNLLAGGAPSALAQAIRASPAHKLLVPDRGDGYDWAGVDRWAPPALVAQTVHGVGQWAEGETIRPARPQSAGGIVLIIAAILVVVFVVLPAVFSVFMMLGGGF